MEHCFKCGIEDTRAQLFDIILPDGISKVCRKCSIIENAPIIRKFSDSKPEENSFKGRTSRISEVEPSKLGIRGISKEDVSLKTLIERNFNANFRENTEIKKELIDNFHWVLKRARKMKHITQERLSKEIRESVAVLDMIENGQIPSGKEGVIRKIENALGVKVMRDNGKEERVSSFGSEIDLGDKELRISNLKEVNGDLPENSEEETSPVNTKEKKSRGWFDF
ncbi:MAG: helix-turn-helix domain-containing protein [Nanoarchaeota archaeon]